MVRVRSNAKRTKYQNVGGETSNPPIQREIGGQSLNASTQREIDGRETTNAASSRCPTAGKEDIVVTVDPDLLNCPICTNPLCPPLYQCILGHIACLSCWEKVQSKCPTCNKPIGGQNIALEKVLESIHLPCPNAKLGCRESVSYSQLKAHTDSCKFGPSPCPIPGCAHKAFSGEWRQHFLKEHWNTCNYYNYCDIPSCYITLNEEYHYYPLLGPGKDVCLVVKEPISNFGNVISLFYVDLADLGQNHFSYELEDSMTGKSYKFQDIASINEWKSGKVHGSYSLVVSAEAPLSSFKLGVVIKRRK